MNAKKKRDHIYAFLAISRDQNKMGIMPKDQLPVQEVILNVIISITNADKSLEHHSYMTLLDNLCDDSFS
jgi:hypothetical protein